MRSGHGSCGEGSRRAKESSTRSSFLSVPLHFVSNIPYASPRIPAHRILSLVSPPVSCFRRLRTMQYTFSFSCFFRELTSSLLWMARYASRLSARRRTGSCTAAAPARFPSFFSMYWLTTTLSANRSPATRRQLVLTLTPCTGDLSALSRRLIAS